MSETVDQTNLVLKQMMLTLAQWSTDMEKVRQDHKEKFQETRSLVMKVCLCHFTGLLFYLFCLVYSSDSFLL